MNNYLKNKNMDNFNLNAMGVKEMDSKEMKSINGGLPLTRLLGYIVGFESVIAYYPDAKSGIGHCPR